MISPDIKSYWNWAAKDVIKRYHLKAGISDKDIHKAIERYAFNTSDGPGDYAAYTDEYRRVLARAIRKNLDRVKRN